MGESVVPQLALHVPLMCFCWQNVRPVKSSVVLTIHSRPTTPTNPPLSQQLWCVGGSYGWLSMDAVDSANVLVRDIPFIAYTSEYTFLYIASRLKVLGCYSRLANPALA